MRDVFYLFIMFFIYSFIGYLFEVICVFFEQKKFTFSRGYMIGPYLPIFGVGSMIVVFFLSKYKGDIITLGIMTMFCCCALEYYTSLVLEKIFKLRWWDYSDKKFNLDGRIALESGVLFGLGGILILRVLNPLITSFLNLFSTQSIILLGSFLSIIMLFDFSLSTFTIFKLKIDTRKYLNKDATNVVKKEVSRSLRKYRYFYNRLFNSFPNMVLKNNMFKKIIKIIGYKVKK